MARGDFDVTASVEHEFAALENTVNLVAFEQSRHRFGHVLVGNKEQEVVHPNPRGEQTAEESIAPFQLARRGCCSPLTTEAAPPR